jgi:hypothetical protein
VVHFCLLISFCIASVVCTQEVITVYYKYSNDKSIGFESQFMEEIKKLHNIRHKKNPISFKFIEQSDYKKIFNQIDNAKPMNKICGISSLTITEDRLIKYDFSYRYLKINQAIIKHKRHDAQDFNTAKFAYLENSIHEEAFYLLKKQYHQIIGIPYKSSKEIKDDMDKKKFNYQIADGIVAFINENREIATELSFFQTEGYGIIYPKNTILKEQLDPAIKHFVSTKRYFDLIKEHFGEKAFEYYKDL